MTTLCIVPCGKAKIFDKHPGAGATPAREVYTGSFAKKCREYAEKFYGDEYVILSAKYGFLRPDEVVAGPYNVSFNNPKTKPIGVKQLKMQADEKGLSRYERIVVLGGRNYVRISEEVFAGRMVEAPLSGYGGIGYMMGVMNEAMRKGVELG